MEDWNSEDPSDAMVEEEEIPDIVMQTIQSQDNEKLIPPWLYLILFFLPALITFSVSYMYLGWDVLFSAITSLAIMNGSINMVIAWLTIRLDGHSNEALDHLETIMDEMDKLEAVSYTHLTLPTN